LSTSPFLDALYVAGLAVSAPYHAFRLLGSRSRRAALAQRWGRVEGPPQGESTLWLHCSSVGEAMLARRLVPALEAAAGSGVALSCSTETGYNTAIRSYGQRTVFRHPLDLSWVVRRVLRSLRPRALLLMEREIWPQLVLSAASQGVPVALINARRFSQRSLWWYRRLGALAQRCFDAISLYLVQEDGDAAFFRSLGVPGDRVRVAGNLKYDNVAVGSDPAAADALRAQIGWTQDPVWVAGSTHEGEEQVVAAAFSRVRAEWPALKLVVAPRYPSRSGRVQRLLSGTGLQCTRWSTLKSGGARGGPPPAVVVDTLGDLAAFYEIADVVFVGGSLVPRGGHNVIEPAALGRPVLIGPDVRNTAEAVDMLSGAEALRIVHDEQELTASVQDFLKDGQAAHAAGRAGQAVIRQRQGACVRHVEALRAWLMIHTATKESARNE